MAINGDSASIAESIFPNTMVYFLAKATPSPHILMSNSLATESSI